MSARGEGSPAPRSDSPHQSNEVSHVLDPFLILLFPCFEGEAVPVIIWLQSLILASTFLSAGLWGLSSLLSTFRCLYFLKVVFESECALPLTPTDATDGLYVY